MSFINFLNSFSMFGGQKIKYMPTSFIDNELNQVDIQENHIHIYTCISIISNNFSKLKLVVKKDGQKIEHPLNYLLNHKLNGYQNNQTIFSTLEAHRNNYGNSFLWKENKTNYRILPPELIRDYKVKNGELTYYINNVSDHRYLDKFPTEIKAKDILHFRHVSSDGIIGLSPISAANANIEMLNNASSTINNYYKNGVHSNLAMESTLSTNDQSNKLAYQDRKEFNTTNAGVNNAGNIIKLPFGHKLTPLAIKMVDLELINSIRYSRDAIASLYNIPNTFLNEQDSNRNVEQDTLTFKSMCISPIANIYANELMFKLLTKKEILENYTIEFDLDSLVEIDTLSKIQTYKEGIINGMITPAQASTKLGYTNNSEHANKHYLQAQMIPLEDYEKFNPLMKDDPNLNGADDNKLK